MVVYGGGSSLKTLTIDKIVSAISVKNRKLINRLG